jgi:hypothetical protein
VKSEKESAAVKIFPILLSQHKYQAGSEKKFPACGDSFEIHIWSAVCEFAKIIFHSAEARSVGAVKERQKK